jgi:MoaA/NifB/PqqE/SkfB family radical SAM enzyme
MDIAALMEKGVLELATGALKTVLFNKQAARQLKAFISVQGDHAVRRRQNAVNGLAIPAFLIASITKNCNLSCSGCYARANGEACKDGEPLSADRWEELFLEAQHLGVSYILIAGGEPLMRYDILEKAANIKNVMFPVFTNAVLLDAGYADFFARNRNLVPVISLEGGPEATDERRGAGVYERTTEAMRLLKKRRVLFGLSVTLTKENLFDVTTVEFARDMRKKGAGVLFYVEYVPADGESGDLAPDAKARGIFENRLHAVRKMSHMLVVAFPGDEDFTEGCLAAGRGFVHINHTGGLEPCPFSPYSDTNVAETPLKQALSSKFLQRVREDGMLKGEHKGGCMLFERQNEVRRLLDL